MIDSIERHAALPQRREHRRWHTDLRHLLGRIPGDFRRVPERWPPAARRTSRSTQAGGTSSRRVAPAERTGVPAVGGGAGGSASRGTSARRDEPPITPTRRTRSADPYGPVWAAGRLDGCRVGRRGGARATEKPLAAPRASGGAGSGGVEGGVAERAGDAGHRVASWVRSPTVYRPAARRNHANPCWRRWYGPSKSIVLLNRSCRPSPACGRHLRQEQLLQLPPARTVGTRPIAQVLSAAPPSSRSRSPPTRPAATGAKRMHLLRRRHVVLHDLPAAALPAAAETLHADHAGVCSSAPPGITSRAKLR